MNTMNHLFGKYLLRSILILLLFIGLNIGFAFSCFTLLKFHTIDTETEILQISQGITYNDQSDISVDSSVLQQLSETSAWAMILDDVGTVIWEYNKPSKLPDTYTVCDVATFSRWYLDEYPTLVQDLSFGLLVVGYEPDNMFGISLSKFYYVTDSGFLRIVIVGGILLLIMNILIVIFLFYHNARSLERAITPILHGIEEISYGHPITLAESGELSNINQKLNYASRYMMKKDKTRADWINGISHDVRTPLSMIMGYAAEMQEDSFLPLQTQKQAAIILFQAEKIRRLVNDLNLASKLEYSLQPLRKERLDLIELGRQVISEFLNNGMDDKYDLEYQICAPTDFPASFDGDTFLLKRMLTNLIWNSISHNPKGCHIKLCIEKDTMHYTYIVSDNGVGISPDKLSMLNENTDPYLNSEETLDAIHGYGLKIVSSIVEAHNGKLIFETNIPTGLRVKISLDLLSN